MTRESCCNHNHNESYSNKDRLENRLNEDLSPDTITSLAELFKIFGDPTRIKILIAIKNHEICVTDLATSLQTTQSAISHQLRILKAYNLVKSRKEGKTVYYSLADMHVTSLLDIGLEHINE